MIKIYLAGTIYTDPIDADWKNRFISVLKKNNTDQQFKIYDPNPINEVGDEVVAIDKKIIESCDYLVAYVKNASFGTAMEIKHAFDKQNIVVFVIDPTSKNLDNIWLKYHSHSQFNSVEGCADVVIDSSNLMIVKKI